MLNAVTKVDVIPQAFTERLLNAGAVDAEPQAEPPWSPPLWCSHSLWGERLDTEINTNIGVMTVGGDWWPAWKQGGGQDGLS